MNGYGLFGKITVKEGEREKMVNILLNAANSLQDLDDCQNYTVSISNDDPNSVYVYEVWKNKKAHEDSLSLESVKTLIREAMPIITDMETISTLEVKGGKGIE